MIVDKPNKETRNAMKEVSLMQGGQSAKASLIECLARKIVNYVGSIFLQIVIYRAKFGHDVGVAESAEVALYFSTFSFVIGYYMRRFFNWLAVKGYLR